MSNVCQICSHPQRLEIDREVVNGVALSFLSREYGLNLQSLYNHKKSHISRQLVTSIQNSNLLESFNLLNRIDSLVKNTEEIFQRNYDAKKDGLALKALDSQRNTFELLSKIAYSLHQAKQLEAEMERDKNGDSEKEAEIFIQESLTFLNDAELEMFIKLQDKIINRTKAVVIKDKKPLPTDEDIIDYTNISHSIDNCRNDVQNIAETENITLQRTKHKIKSIY